MSSPAPGPVGVIYNASGSPIVDIVVAAHVNLTGAAPALTAFPAGAASGSSVLSGCSFVAPPGSSFSLSITFGSGHIVNATVAASRLPPVSFGIFAFLNGIVMAGPDGTARELDFTRAEGLLRL